jgi:hypothetical protein
MMYNYDTHVVQQVPTLHNRYKVRKIGYSLKVHDNTKRTGLYIS